MTSPDYSLSITQNASGGIAAIRIGEAVFSGYEGSLEYPSYASVTQEMTREAECIAWHLTLTLAPEIDAMRCGWLKIGIPYAYPPYGMRAWTGRAGFPADIFELGGRRIYYGDVCYGTVIPAVSLYDESRNIGLTVCKAFGRTGGRLSFEFGTYHETTLTVHFSELALYPGKPVQLTLLLRGHEGCWRPGLQWIVDRYPGYFKPTCADMTRFKGAFAITNPFTTAEALDRLPVAWSEIHNHFPAYGNYLPDEASWTSVVIHDYPHLKNEAPHAISTALIHQHIARLHQRNILAMLYLQCSGDCLIEDAQALYPDAIARDEAGKMIPTWKECCFMNGSASTSFGRHLRQVIDKMLKEYPEIDGVFLDQLCYQCLDYAHDDGKSADKNHRPIAEYGVSYDDNCVYLSRELHKRGMAIWANGPFDIECAQYADGVMSEGTSGISETHKYLCICKPLLVHTYPTDIFKAESMMRYCLLTGATWSYGGSSTLRTPPALPHEVQQLIDSYRPLLTPLLDASVWLAPRPFALPPGYRGELFRSGDHRSAWIAIIGTSNAKSLTVTIQVPHGSTALLRSRAVPGCTKIDFQDGNELIFPNSSDAYLLEFYIVAAD